MTPYEIKLLLDIYAMGDDGEHPEPIYEGTLKAFMECGLIEPNPAQPPPGITKRYVCTKMGAAYIEIGLMQVPFPVQEWRIPTPDDWPHAGDEQP